MIRWAKKGKNLKSKWIVEVIDILNIRRKSRKTEEKEANFGQGLIFNIFKQSGFKIRLLYGSLFRSKHTKQHEEEIQRPRGG